MSWVKVFLLCLPCIPPFPVGRDVSPVVDASMWMGPCSSLHPHLPLLLVTRFQNDPWPRGPRDAALQRGQQGTELDLTDPRLLPGQGGLPPGGGD